MTTHVVPRADTRLGFHYFFDTLHYRETDLQTWVPEVKALGGSWLTLVAPSDRAVPETFIRGLIEEKIEPILHFHLPLDRSPDLESLNLLFRAYANWGVHYIVLYDRPNCRRYWASASWSQSDLVERFLDYYLPAASLIHKAGMAPVFPPLEPGGDYWDTAFLKAALQGILRRDQSDLAESLVLGAYAWAKEATVSWGAGGPERWPMARPYSTPPNQEDQRGFYIFDWYLAIASAVLDQSRPVILLASGPGSPVTDLDAHTRTNVAIARLMQNLPSRTNGAAHPVSSHVLACNFWILSAAVDSREAESAWFQPDGRALPIVTALTRLGHGKDLREAAIDTIPGADFSTRIKPINHYVLVPRQPDLSMQFLQGHWSVITEKFPTIGFSLEEATLAEQVTVLADETTIPEEDLECLRCAGCKVERLSGNGISIAPIE